MEETREYVGINGSRQSILTMSTGRDKPVLLILHGGAGLPDAPLYRAYHKELAEFYTVVCWDQRGCGFSCTGGPLSIELLLSDLKALVDHLKEEYRQEKICIAGHSWGSYLGVRFADRFPEDTAYYIGTGQEVSAFASETDKYRFIKEQAQQRGDRRTLRKLARFGEPDGYAYPHNGKRAKDFTFRTVIRYAGYFSRSGPSMGRYLADYLKLYGGYYGAGLAWAAVGALKSYLRLNAEMDQKDLVSCITELKVPVLLISGEEDMICPVPAAQRWFDALKAPEKEFVKIKDASHMVCFEKPRVWDRLLIDLLKEPDG